jgi:hypothetical protein
MKNVTTPGRIQIDDWRILAYDRLKLIRLFDIYEQVSSSMNEQKGGERQMSLCGL